MHFLLNIDRHDLQDAPKHQNGRKQTIKINFNNNKNTKE